MGPPPRGACSAQAPMHLPRTIFISLTVADLSRSVAFHRALAAVAVSGAVHQPPRLRSMPVHLQLLERGAGSIGLAVRFVRPSLRQRQLRGA